MLSFGKVYKATHVESSAAVAVFNDRRLVIDFGAKGYCFGNITLNQPTEKPVVLVAVPRIDPVASTTV
jgi:hypothetical protein